MKPKPFTKGERDALRAELVKLKADHAEAMWLLHLTSAAVGADTLALQDVTRERDALKAQKDTAYSERDQLVAALAKLANKLGWMTGIGQHPATDLKWEPDWRTIVFIDLPTGQVSWHIHDSERPLVGWMPLYPGEWDGHSTPEKYRRLNDLPPRKASR